MGIAFNRNSLTKCVYSPIQTNHFHHLLENNSLVLLPFFFLPSFLCSFCSIIAHRLPCPKVRPLNCKWTSENIGRHVRLPLGINPYPKTLYRFMMYIPPFDKTLPALPSSDSFPANHQCLPARACSQSAAIASPSRLKRDHQHHDIVVKGSGDVRGGYTIRRNCIVYFAWASKRQTKTQTSSNHTDRNCSLGRGSQVPWVCDCFLFDHYAALIGWKFGML